MKKLAVSILSIIAIVLMQLGGSSVSATNIDEATARQLGSYYMSVMTGKDVQSSQVSLAYQYINSEQNIPAAYIFNVEDLGFVIVSGSDMWYPILGFSTEGELNVEKMSPSFKVYFENLCHYIEYSQNTGVALIDNIQSEWDDLYYQKLPQLKNPKAKYWLLDNAWGQGNDGGEVEGAPTYNKFCPQKDKDGITYTAYVGCVATSTSQVIHYWKYPNHAKGYSSYTSYGFYGGYFSVDYTEDGHYQYDLMPEKLTSSSSVEQIDATALLNYHVGVSLNMNYDWGGSGAYNDDIPNSLKKYFKYEPSAQYISRTNPNYSNMTETPIYTNSEWVDILKTEIDGKRPMVYGGYSTSGSGRDAGGHAFVCDGYHPSDVNKFHFNWGWDGQPNSWYDVRNNKLNPGNYNFYFAQDAVIGITPPADSIASNPDVSIDAVIDNPVALHPAYPNPAITNIVIPYELNSDNATMMQIYSIEGRLIESVRLMPNENAISIDVSRYPKGLYIYKVGTKAQKFIVQ